MALFGEITMGHSFHHTHSIAAVDPSKSSNDSERIEAEGELFLLGTTLSLVISHNL